MQFHVPVNDWKVGAEFPNFTRLSYCSGSAPDDPSPMSHPAFLPGIQCHRCPCCQKQPTPHRSPVLVSIPILVRHSSCIPHWIFPLNNVQCWVALFMAAPSLPSVSPYTKFFSFPQISVTPSLCGTLSARCGTCWSWSRTRFKGSNQAIVWAPYKLDYTSIWTCKSFSSQTQTLHCCNINCKGTTLRLRGSPSCHCTMLHKLKELPSVFCLSTGISRLLEVFSVLCVPKYTLQKNRVNIGLPFGKDRGNVVRHFIRGTTDVHSIIICGRY